MAIFAATIFVVKRESPALHDSNLEVAPQPVVVQDIHAERKTRPHQPKKYDADRKAKDAKQLNRHNQQYMSAAAKGKGPRPHR